MYRLAWEDAESGRIGRATVGFSAKELAEDAVRTLGRFHPEREYWVESDEEATVAAGAMATPTAAIAATAVEVPGAYVAEGGKAAVSKQGWPAALPAKKAPFTRHAAAGWRVLPPLVPDQLAGDRQN